jgi:uncharacterized protein (DUF2267 family)
MRTTKRVIQIGTAGAMTIGAIATFAPDSPVGRAARRLARRLQRDVRYMVASAPGILYRLAGRRPDPNASDDVLADRIRSSIGPLEHKLDIPRIHVMVQNHVAILHGEVDSPLEASAIESAVLDVSGVDGVESHLHHGLTSGDTRPSEGAVTQPSAALDTLLTSARDAGARNPARALHAVLCALADRIPENERSQFIAQLPADVRALMRGAHHRGAPAPTVRTVAAFVDSAVAEGGMEPSRAEAITRAVLATLPALVPHEAQDVAAVLPHELRDLWGAQSAMS